MRTPMLLLAAWFLGCGPSTPPAKDPGPTDDTSTGSAPADNSTSARADNGSKEPKDVAVALPTACANPGEKVCVMPEAFAKKLCNGFYPDLALYMFSPNSPWTRAFVNLRKETDAWNSRNGPASDAKLVYDEEVLIVSEQKPDLKGMT